jgi:hypothetical protein
MLNYEKIKNKPRILRSLTGLSPAAFDQLGVPFRKAYEQEWEQAETQRETARQRQHGGGRKASLETIQDKLLFILLYFKFYPIQELLGFLFGLSQPQANYWVHTLTPILNKALGYEKQLPARKTREIAQVLAECPELEFIIDGTERPIQRPKETQRQQENYSGKKKDHTVKNNVITHKPTKKIKALSPTVPGKKHDKKLADQEQYRFPPGSKLWKDTGFQGYEPAGVITYQPKKKPKGGQLTSAEKEHNQAISKERMGVEHSIGGVKVFHIVRDIYRNHKQGFEDLIMETACGLHNLRLDFPMAA